MSPPLPMDFNTYYLVVLGVSVSLIVLTTFWIVYILIQIEAHKVLSVEPEENTLEMTETTGSFTEEDGDDVMSSSSSPTPIPDVSVVHKPEIRRRGRALRWSFQLMQLVTVLAVLLLTYLILVVSKAPAWATILGSLCVFVVFFRYQIGDELRRNRKDRLWLLLTLFLFLAGLMSLSTFSFQQLVNGEIYQGPARILQSDASAYNNSEHDPRTRGDVLVEWGSHWGCPQSGNKVCRADVTGVMCSSSDYQQSQQEEGGGYPYGDDYNHPHRGRRRRRRRRRRVEDEQLAQENEQLEAENEHLQEEVDELELENEAATYQDEEDVDVGDEEIEYVAEEATEAEEGLADANIDSEIEQIEDQEDTEVSEEAVDQDEEEIDELEDEESIENEIYEEVEDEELDAADEYEEAAEEDEEELEDVDKEISEEEMEDEEYKTGYYDEEGFWHETDDEEFEEEAEEEFEEEVIVEDEEDEWYWDEITTDYDDDFFESDYWEYDWDSLWDEELDCDGLFQEDVDEGSVDPSVPPSEDGMPSIMIYGSCKHCEAYVLDYFAEEAFREVELYAIQARLYITGAAVGAILSFISYLRYRVSPAQENQMELLGGSSDGVFA